MATVKKAAPKKRATPKKATQKKPTGRQVVENPEVTGDLASITAQRKALEEREKAIRAAKREDNRKARAVRAEKLEAKKELKEARANLKKELAKIQPALNDNDQEVIHSVADNLADLSSGISTALRRFANADTTGSGSETNDLDDLDDL